MHARRVRVGRHAGTARPAAQRMPAMMSESKPPHLPSTRTGSTRTLRPTLAMPMPLFVKRADEAARLRAVPRAVFRAGGAILERPAGLA